ncbi:MAG TPA: hypothetical protein VHW00_23845 [Thermoanaerobaculia bacterium]|nr:hypothetical protein [Thermoanaerobaculia bacterium]
MNSEILNTIYDEFRRYPCEALRSVPDDEHVNDGLAADLTAKLCHKELRTLAADQLLDYYYLAVEHIGTRDDLRHFLPRILDLLLNDPNGYLAPELLPNLLERAEARELEPSQKEALRAYLRTASSIVPETTLHDAMRIIDGA